MQLDLVAGIRDALAARYVVDREVGHGGMAMVCRARDLVGDRDVAIKVLYPDLARAVGGERFLREIAILADLDHPNILPLLDSGTAEVMPGVRVPWYVMPFVAEQSLRARLQREGPLPVELALRYTGELCAALTHAHAQGYIHRDIKPENILLRGDQAVLADFGIARAVTVAGGSTLSSTGIVVGTPAYMSPEQSVGSDKLDGRSDLYSLGIVLYEMLAGHPPFTGSTPQSVSARHQFEAPPPIAVVRPGLPSGIESAVDKVLAKTPADRFGRAAEFAEALTRGATSRPTLPRRTRIQRGIMTAAVVCAVSSAAWFWGPAFLSGEQLDPSRYVVLPFRLRDSTATPLISGSSCEQLISDILGRIPDHNLVSSLTVGSTLASTVGKLTPRKAMGIARGFGAGRVIWGEVALLNDSLRITGNLYDAASGREFRSVTVRLPSAGITIGRLAGEFANLTYKLVLPGQPTPETASDVLGAKSFDAWLLYATGDSALNEWNLPFARSKYLEALTLDPDYPSANLKLAQVGEWLDEPTENWSSFVDRAAARAGSLNRVDRLLAKSLVAIAHADYPAACSAYRAVLSYDSLDYRGWFGLGECLTRNSLVVEDTSTTSGWRFASSYEAGIDAFERGLALVPSAHHAYTGASFRRLADRLMTSTTSIRLGRSTGPAVRYFVAYPGLIADTLAFTPYPAEGAVGGTGDLSSLLNATQHNRQRLLNITTGWLARFPTSLPAMVTQSEALETLGRLSSPAPPPTALDLIVALRRGQPASLNLDLAVREVRMRVRLGHFAVARSIAESALAVSPHSPGDGVTLASLAALIGRVDRAATLLGANATYPFASSLGTLVSAPPVVSNQANRLLVYAAFGSPRDSLTSILGQLRSNVAAAIDVNRRRAVLDALLFRPQLLAFPSVLGRPTGPFPFAHIEGCIAQGDKVCATNALRARALLRPPALEASLPPDFRLLEARLKLALGDTMGARQQTRLILDSLHALNTAFLEEVTQAASIGRAMQFCLAIECREGNADVASMLDALWGVQR